MHRTAKKQQIEELRELIVGKMSVVLTDYKGMTVAEMFALRREFDKVGAGYRVVKNTLAKLAVADTEYAFLGEALQGTIGIAYSDDPVAPAKVLADFAKAVASLNRVVARVESGEGTLGLLVNDPTVWENLRRVLGSAERSAVLRYLVRSSLEEEAEKADEVEETAGKPPAGK